MTMIRLGPAKLLPVSLLRTNAMRRPSEDRARARASERLDASLMELWAEGLDAVGEVGDSDPVVALRDALAKHSPDEVIVSTHPPGRSNWLERDVVGKARTLCGPIPVFHVVASGVAAAA